jgi:hypothetical protein
VAASDTLIDPSGTTACSSPSRFAKQSKWCPQRRSGAAPSPPTLRRRNECLTTTCLVVGKHRSIGTGPKGRYTAIGEDCPVGVPALAGNAGKSRVIMMLSFVMKLRNTGKNGV